MRERKVSMVKKFSHIREGGFQGRLAQGRE